MEIKIGIMGIKGRMGQALCNAIEVGNHPLKLIGGTTRNHLSADLNKLAQEANVLIDFSTPDALEDNLDAAIQTQTPIVIGTTGLQVAHLTSIDDAAKKIPLIYAANMSIGVNLLAYLVEISAKTLVNKHVEIDIRETHHRHKKDAPSGTAKLLAQSALQAMNRHFDPIPWFTGSSDTPARTADAIGLQVQRVGEHPGTHDVSFHWGQESLTLTHHAFDRRIFADGALQAAMWLVERRDQPGRYTMRHVLGIKE